MSTLIALLAIVAALALGYGAGRWRARAATARLAPPTPQPPASVVVAPSPPAPPSQIAHPSASVEDELHRLVRSFEAAAARCRGEVRDRDAALLQLSDFAEDRRRAFVRLAASHAETARYRQLVVDIENNAASNLFGPSAPDDLKLIVGVGPVLERMLHQLGVTRYQQIAHWTQRDIDEFDARLPEFPGRIRRDTWVTQARELHLSKYGEHA
jgi:predicted flap endonuclease-1-like 5' DNA nuclease